MKRSEAEQPRQASLGRRVGLPGGCPLSCRAGRLRRKPSQGTGTNERTPSCHSGLCECHRLSWLPWLLSDGGGFVSVLDKVGRLFLIEPSNHNLAKLECGLHIFSLLSLNQRRRAGGWGSRNKATSAGGEGLPGTRDAGPAGLEGRSPGAQGAGRSGGRWVTCCHLWPEWRFQGWGQNGVPSYPSPGNCTGTFSPPFLLPVLY